MPRTPSPYRREGRAGWFGTYYDENGKRRRDVKLATDDEGYDIAAARLHQKRRHVELIREGVATREQFEEAEAGRERIDGLLPKMLDSVRRRQRAEAYITELRYWIGRFAAECPAKAVGSVTRRDVEKFLDSLVDQGLSPTTRNAAHRRLSAFFCWAADQRCIADPPTRGIKRLREDRDRRESPRSLTHDELRRLLAVATPDRKLRYLLGARAGLRWLEIHRLRWGHLDLERGWIVLTSDMTKESRDAELEMAPDIQRLATELKPADAKPRDPVFTHRPHWGTWLRDLDKAGIVHVVWREDAPRKDHGRGSCMERIDGWRDDRGQVVSRRCLRKTFGTHLAAVEPNMATVSHLMRHADPRLTRKLYQDARLIHGRTALDRLDSLDDVEPSGSSLAPKTPPQSAAERNTAQHSLETKTALTIHKA